MVRRLSDRDTLIEMSGAGVQVMTGSPYHPFLDIRGISRVPPVPSGPRHNIPGVYTVQLYRPGMTLQWLYSLPWDTEPWTR